jgi:hypothetical protein
MEVSKPHPDPLLLLNLPVLTNTKTVVLGLKKENARRTPSTCYLNADFRASNVLVVLPKTALFPLKNL